MPAEGPSQSVETQWSTTGDGEQKYVIVAWTHRSHAVGEISPDQIGGTSTPRPVGPIIKGHGPFPESYNRPEAMPYLAAKAGQKGKAKFAPGRQESTNVDKKPDDLDSTQQATAAESQHGNNASASMPPPAVTGMGRRTDESIDPGSAAAIAAGVASNSAPSNTAAPANTAAPTNTGTPPVGGPPVDELLGTTYLGKYELVSVLGAGGMGVIYEGRQIFLDRIVAIKMLKNNLASVKARMRFHQEAKAASQLNHPGIVGIIDFGVDDQDRPYMVMEHVEGCTFSDLIRERVSLSVQDALPVLLEICDALSEAHHKGIVHRDLKPSNIMLVVAPDGKVHTKLLDFGIAKMLDIQDQTLQGMTKTGEALGTPLYMSPEQIQGTKVTYRSDLYSLGCMMYMCLTGTPPFVGENKLRTMEKHCTTNALPLTQASRGKEFPPGIEPIIFRLLEKNPADRYDSVDHLKDALIDMAVTNGFMRRPQVEQSAAGQLYMTGVIPEMSRTISDMVPGSGLTQATDALAGDESDERPPALTRTSGREKTAYPTSEKNRSRDLVGRKKLAIVGGVVCGAIILSGSFLAVVWNMKNGHKEPVVPAKVENPLQRVDFMPESTSKSERPQQKKDTLSGDEEIERLYSNKDTYRSLDLSKKAGISEQGVLKLSQFSNLRILNLSNSDISEVALSHLKNLDLLFLDLDGNQKIHDWSLNSLATQKHLKELSLANTGITDYGLKYLRALHSLESLFLGANRKISDLGLVNLNLRSSRLKTLGLNSCAISDLGVSEIAKAPELVSLSLSGNSRVGDMSIEALLPASDRLVQLHLEDLNITDVGIKKLVRFKKLGVLNLSGVALNSAALDALSELKWLNNLYVTDCGLSSKKIADLQAHLSSTIVSSNERPPYIFGN